MLATLYTLALGLIVAAFVEIGIYTFFKEPEWTEAFFDQSACTEAEIEKRTNALNTQHERMKRFQGLVSILSLIFSTVLLALSLTLSARIGVLGDGILLGGVFVLIYGVGFGILTKARVLRFVVVTASLAIALVLGYLKFVPHN